MENELVQEFSRNSFVVEDKETAAQCASLCVSFGLKPADLVSSWEVFFLNRQLNGNGVSKSHINSFRQHLQEEQQESIRNQKTGWQFYTKDYVDTLLDEGEGELKQVIPQPVTPKAKHDVQFVQDANNVSIIDLEATAVIPKNLVSMGKAVVEASRPKTQDSPETPFSKRSNKYAVVCTFNKDLTDTRDDRISLSPVSEDDIVRRLPPIERCRVAILGSPPKRGCRFMYDRVEERCMEIEKRIKKFNDALNAREQHNFSHNIGIASQEPVMVVGRICCDGEGGHLNDKSVLLEGSVEHSSGQKVHLDLRDISNFSLFPGQVLGVEGKNPSGFCLVASRLFDSCPPPIDQGSMNQDEFPSKHQGSSHPNGNDMDPLVPQSLSFMVATGPFTASDNLYFEPLAELLAHARRKRPMLLLLIGPFVDSEQPLIKQGLVDKTFNRIFQEELRTRVEDYCQEMGDGARVLLVPSCRDAHHDCIFPQSPFMAEDFEDPSHQIMLLANPSMFSCNEVTVGCCSIDVLKHLSSEEIARTPAGVSSDRMTRLASHIIAQSSFYPLFPAPVGMTLDLSMAPDALSLSSMPNILFTPSDLGPFVKVLSFPLNGQSGTMDTDLLNFDVGSTFKCLCINPGRLTKGTTGGTFTEIFVTPSLSSSSAVDHEIHLRTKVVISRI